MIFTTPFFDEEVHVGEFGLDAVGVGTGFVNLVDGKDDGDTGSLGVVDGFDGLGHDFVIGGDDDDSDIRHLGTAGTHGCESFVARGVEEGNLAAVGSGDLVGTDVLGDAARLTGNDVGLADIVKERGLTVVHMTHDGDDGVAGDEVFGTVFLFNLVEFVDDVGTGEVNLKAELVSDELDGFGIKTLVDTDEYAYGHAGADDLSDGHIHHGGQLVGGDELRHLQRLLAFYLVELLLLDTLVNLLTFFAVVLGGFGFAHGAETGQCVADLFFDFGVVNFDLYGFLFFLLFLFGFLGLDVGSGDVLILAVLAAVLRA